MAIVAPAAINAGMTMAHSFQLDGGTKDLADPMVNCRSTITIVTTDRQLSSS